VLYYQASRDNRLYLAISVNLWPPRFCFSAGNGWWSFGHEFPW